MSYKKMPPQAYTKETLQEAFEWWNQQPEDFRDKVQDKDDLVGYYLKVRRSPMDTEVSEVAKASFSSELKGLAKNLDDFESYKASRAMNNRVGGGSNQSFSVPPSFITPEKTEQQAPSVQLNFPEMTKSAAVAENALVFERKKSVPAVKPQIDVQAMDSNKYFKLDTESLKSLRKIRKALNLSSDQEALRAIVAAGTSRLSSLCSKK